MPALEAHGRGLRGERVLKRLAAALALALLAAAARAADTGDMCGKSCTSVPKRDKPRTVEELARVVLSNGMTRKGGCAVNEAQTPCRYITYFENCAGDGRAHTLEVAYKKRSGKESPVQLSFFASTREPDGSLFSVRLNTNAKGELESAFAVPGQGQPGHDLDAESPMAVKLLGLELKFFLSDSLTLPYMGKETGNGCAGYHDPW